MAHQVMVPILGLLLMIVLLTQPLVDVGLLNLSSIHVVRWMLGDEQAGVRAGLLLTRIQRLAQLPPRQAGRVHRFRSLAVDPPSAIPLRPVDLYERLGVAREHGDTEAVEALEQQLAGLLPQYPLDAPTPIETLPGWTLLGYDLLWPMVGPSGTEDIALYWERDVPLARSPAMTRGGDWDWIWAGQRVYQIGQVENLAPNGGFESQVDLRSGYTPGWGLLPANCAVPPSFVVLAEHAERPSVVLSLMSNSGSCRVDSHSAPLPTSGPYLLSAWILVNGGKNSKACVGHGWYGAAREAFCASESRWLHRARVVLPRPEDEQLSLYVEVRGRGAHAFFDDILFFPLDLESLSGFDRLMADYGGPSSTARRPERLGR